MKVVDKTNNYTDNSHDNQLIIYAQKSIDYI